MTRVRDIRGDKDCDIHFGERMFGTSEFASMIAQHFALICKNWI